METRTVKMEEIQRLPEVQIRALVSKKTVNEYAEMIGEGTHFDPVDVFPHPEGGYILADGWHRYLAREERGLKSIEVNIHEVIADAVSEAIEFSCERNTRHGLRMSNEDKRNAIRTILNNEKLRRKSDRQISKMVSVSPQLVAEVRSEAAAEDAEAIKKKAKKKKASSTTVSDQYSDNDNVDEQAERFKTFKGWVTAGYIDWPAVIEVFASKTHFPMLMPKKDAKLRLVVGESTRTMYIVRVDLVRKGDDTMLEVEVEKPKEKSAKA